MKKCLGFLIIIILGVLSIVAMISRSESIDKNLSKDNNYIELFAKN